MVENDKTRSGAGPKVISGLQQVGVGNRALHPLWHWYRRHFGMDIKIFEEIGPVEKMQRYTGDEVHERHAALGINMQGGGGFEVWEFITRQAKEPDFAPQLGDLGIFVTKLKSRDVPRAYKKFKARGLNLLSEPVKSRSGDWHFYLRDPDGNIFEVVEASSWFGKSSHLTGGVCGAVVGVSDMEKSLALYRDVLEYDQVLSDETGTFEDWKGLPGTRGEFRRVLLKNSKPRKGAFGPLLGDSCIELVQKTDAPSRKIFEDRYWGDMGFIHLCFDVRNMDALQKECEEKGFPFAVDSANAFDMGEASGRFAYIEDPDGTLIEFVEAHKLPIVKSLNWYFTLQDRDPEKPLPRWMLKALRFNKVKD